MKKLFILLFSLSLSFTIQADFSSGMHDYKKGDFDSAFQEWFTLAEQKNHAVSQYNIAKMYKNGKGVKQSKKQALKWFKKAYSQGETFA
ncbi:tetratricopeptide repeat protein [Candidatus Thiodubiliella endoseptemdiera]|uniref:tetratricopeptide repeat protein n=1 Tax=Candidatus Thiodubiliella endoseptemdiera TaxID=2738886 RepID=UPI0034DF2320